MGSWAAVTFECETDADRRRLLRWFERRHPVTVPVDRYSVTAAIDVADGRRPAEYAWLGRYLYLTTPGDPRPVVERSVDRWRRAAVVAVDGETETVDGGRFIRSGPDPTTRELEGVAGHAGNALLYTLAMRHGFRFRPCAARAPPDQETPHATAFTDPAEQYADLEQFVDRMRPATGVDPTDAGLALLRDDPAGDERFVYDGPGGTPTIAGDPARARTLVKTDGGRAHTADDAESDDEGGESADTGSLLARVGSLFPG